MARLVSTALAGVVLLGGGPASPQDFSGCYLQNASVEQAGQRPSPLGETSFTLGGQEAKLCYGRPSARGRKIMGGLVPYGTPWRMGANEATALHLPFAARVGDVQVEPGDYSLYAVPAEGVWTIVVNRQADRWGIPINGDVRSADVGSFQRQVDPMSDMVETLTYVWMPEGAGSGRIVMTWEHTRLEIPLRRTGGT